MTFEQTQTNIFPHISRFQYGNKEEDEKSFS